MLQQSERQEAKPHQVVQFPFLPAGSIRLVRYDVIPFRLSISPSLETGNEFTQLSLQHLNSIYVCFETTGGTFGITRTFSDNTAELSRELRFTSVHSISDGSTTSNSRDISRRNAGISFVSGAIRRFAKREESRISACIRFARNSSKRESNHVSNWSKTFENILLSRERVQVTAGSDREKRRRRATFASDKGRGHIRGITANTCAAFCSLKFCSFAMHAQCRIALHCALLPPACPSFVRVFGDKYE